MTANYLLDWARYHVSKPRLPTEADNGIRWVDDKSSYPRTFSSFQGKHNEAIFSTLKATQETFEYNKTLPDVMIMCGQSGSGKSAICTVFCQNLTDLLSLHHSHANKFYMMVNAASYRKDYDHLWIKINRFSDANFDRLLTVKYRLLVIDNAAAITPSNQQDLKKILEAQGPRLKVILVCDDPKTQLLTYFHSRAVIFKTKQIAERDALRVLLSFCNRNSIGFDLDGIRMLFTINSNISLSNIFDLLQKVFVEKYFISQENVCKVSGLALPLPTVTAAQALEPITRCEICTLYPPCKHMTLEMMTALGAQRREQLPRYKTGSMSCPEFVRAGTLIFKLKFFFVPSQLYCIIMLVLFCISMSGYY